MNDLARCAITTALSAVVVVAMGFGTAMVAAGDPSNAPESSPGGLSPVPAAVDPGTDVQQVQKANERLEP